MKKTNVFEGIGQEIRRLSRKIQAKHLFFVALVIFVLALIPLFMIAPYNYPCYDDLVFGHSTHAVYEETGSLWEVFQAAGQVVRENYTGWQGTFVAIFLFALQPAIFGVQYYAFVPAIMLAALITGTVFCAWVIARRLLSANRWTAGLIALVLSFACIHLVPVPNRSFYWYNGAIYYTFFQGLFFLMVGLLIVFSLPGKRWKRHIALFFASVLCFLIGGSNYVTGAFAGVFLVFLIAVLLLKKKKAWLGLLLPLAVLAICLLISVMAPGNAVRQMQMPEQLGLVKSLVYSLGSVFLFAGQWTTPGLLLLMLLLLPFMWKHVGNVNFSFRYPGLVTLASIIYIAIGMFPHIYAVSVPGPPRLTNIIFFTFVMLLAGNLLYWTGWLRRKCERYSAEKGLGLGQAVVNYCKSRAVPALSFFLLCAIFLIVAPVRLVQPFTFDFAYGTWRNGMAQGYGSEMAQRFELMENAKGQDLVFEPLQYEPELLLYFELTADPSSDVNIITANYFGLSSVRLSHENLEDGE